MSSAKRNTIRSMRRRPMPQAHPTSQRGREHWITRWIGAAKRRAAKSVEATPVKASSASIIRLSWADTFGRPARTGHAGIFCPAETIVQLLPR